MVEVMEGFYATAQRDEKSLDQSDLLGGDGHTLTMISHLYVLQRPQPSQHGQ